MSKNHSLRNLLAVGGATGSRLVGTLVLYGLLARMLGPAKFGEFTFWYTIGIVLGALSDYGFGQQILIRLAADTPERIKAEGERILAAKYFLVAALFSLAIVAAVFDAFGTLDMVWIITVLLACACATLIEFFGVMLRARAQYQNEAFRSFWATFAASVGAAVAGYVSGSLILACSVMLAVRFVVLYFQYHAAKKAVNFEISSNSLRNIARSLNTLRGGLNFAADGAALQLLANIDVAIAKYLLAPEAAGIYMSGSRLVQAALAGVPVLSSVFIPTLVANRKKGNSEKPELLRWVIALVSTAAFLLFTLGSRKLPGLLFGPGFSSLSDILPMLGVVVAARYLLSIDGFDLSIKERQMDRAKVQVALSLIAIGCAAAFAIFDTLAEIELASIVAAIGIIQLVAYRLLSTKSA